MPIEKELKEKGYAPPPPAFAAPQPVPSTALSPYKEMPLPGARAEMLRGLTRAEAEKLVAAFDVNSGLAGRLADPAKAQKLSKDLLTQNGQMADAFRAALVKRDGEYLAKFDEYNKTAALALFSAQKADEYFNTATKMPAGSEEAVRAATEGFRFWKAARTWEGVFYTGLSLTAEGAEENARMFGKISYFVAQTAPGVSGFVLMGMKGTAEKLEIPEEVRIGPAGAFLNALSIVPASVLGRLAAPAIKYAVELMEEVKAAMPRPLLQEVYATAGGGGIRADQLASLAAQTAQMMKFTAVGTAAGLDAERLALLQRYSSRTREVEQKLGRESAIGWQEQVLDLHKMFEGAPAAGLNRLERHADTALDIAARLGRERGAKYLEGILRLEREYIGMPEVMRASMYELVVIRGRDPERVLDLISAYVPDKSQWAHYLAIAGRSETAGDFTFEVFARQLRDRFDMSGVPLEKLGDAIREKFGQKLVDSMKRFGLALETGSGEVGYNTLKDINKYLDPYARSFVGLEKAEEKKAKLLTTFFENATALVERGVNPDELWSTLRIQAAPFQWNEILPPITKAIEGLKMPAEDFQAAIANLKLLRSSGTATAKALNDALDTYPTRTLLFLRDAKSVKGLRGAQLSVTSGTQSSTFTLSWPGTAKGLVRTYSD